MTDVSTRLLADMLAFMRERGVPAEPVLAQLRARIGEIDEVGVDYLVGGSGRVHWATYVEFTELWAKALGPDAERAFIERSLATVTRWTSTFHPIIRLAASPRQVYDVALRYGGPASFSNIQVKLLRFTPTQVETILELRPEDRDCESFFRMCAIMLPRIPSMIGLPDAVLEATTSPRRGHFVITLPPSASLLYRLKRRLQLIWAPRTVLDNFIGREEALRLTLHDRTKALEAVNQELEVRLAALHQTQKIAEVGSWEWLPDTLAYSWSPESYRIFGIEPGTKLTRELINDCIHPDDLPGVHERAKAVRDGADTLETEHRIVRPGGEIRYVHERGAVVRDAAGRPVRVIGTVQDTTAARRNEASLIAAKEAADQANRFKTTFLASMSHEIRTPMTSVLGFADLLAQGTTPPDKRQTYADKIVRNGRHLLALIDDILDLSKIEAGHLALQRSRFSPAAEITQAIDLFRHEAERRHLTLEVDLGPLPKAVTSDQVRFRQIVINLLSNAVKFTDAGRIHLATRVVQGEGGEAIEMVVSDTGVGIPPEHHQALFQPFSQPNVLTGRPRGGSGLGLALARNLARALGGDVTLLRSAPNEGSVFRATVAQTLAAPPKGSALPIGSGMTLRLDGGLQGFPQGFRVLVVEDNLDIQEIVRRVLESVGANVATAANGADCLDAFGRGSYDLVVMDMQMPVLDGFATTQRLRAEGRTLPIIAMTAFAVSGEREKCLAAGCSDFLPKPIDTLTLLRTVARWAQPEKT